LISCGWIDGVDLSVTVQAVETGQRHFEGVVIFAWLELTGGCISGGDVIDALSDNPFELIQSEQDPSRWGTWHVDDPIGERLSVNYADNTSECFGSGCHGYPGLIEEPTGPWMPAEDWYFDWLALHPVDTGS